TRFPAQLLILGPASGLDLSRYAARTTEARMKKLKAFWFTGFDNVGDTLTTPLLNHFGYEVELVDRNTRGKLLAVGSTMVCVRPGDFVWGAGCLRDLPTT